jgi:kumamolisin
MRNRLSETAIVGALLLAGGVGWSQAQEAMIRRTGNLAPAVKQAVQVDRLKPDERVRFSISLPMRDQDVAEKSLKSIYMPGDPLYRHYMKKGEFAARFGASQADYDAVIAFVKQQGLEVVGTHPNRLLLEVAGTADKVEKTFAFHLMHYRAANGRVFRAPDAEPALPASISPKIAGIIGLDGALERRSNLMTPSNQAGANNQIGTGPNGGLAPSDIRTAYGLNGVAENGAGQTLGLLEQEDYLPTDINSYQREFNLNVTVNQEFVSNSMEFPGGPGGECTLDIELAMALATNLNQIIVYLTGGDPPDLPAGYSQIADDDLAQQVSTSWYSGTTDVETPASITNAEYADFMQMAYQGQTFYAASGDFGDKVNTGTDTNGNPILLFGVQDPSAQPYVTGVGGTTLVTAGPGGAYVSETTWPGSGGGISGFWPLPYYQFQGVSSGSGGSSTFRNVPDVSLDSDPNNSGYAVYFNGRWIIEGGTSCAAPLWASFTAIVNQRRASHGDGQLGFLNPTLYYLANIPAYAAGMHDITTGNNGFYPAVTGYDNCTGWGTFNGGNLMNALLTPATGLNEIYVNGSYNGPQYGSLTDPYKTVTSAVNAASSATPTLISIRGGAYSENPPLNKPGVLINNGGGNVVIGK